jgi:hypothetical protein
MRKLAFVFTLLIAIAWTSPAHAWGNTGHRTVCEIAFRNLTPTARAEVVRLLAAHPVIPVRAPRDREFGWACTYPDNPVEGGPGRRSPEHFVNFDRTLAAVASSTGCGPTPACVLSAIREDYGRLRNTTLSDADRAEALIYLGHWVGDVHQPLHASFRDDQGGNEINSSGRCTRALHSTWDTCMLTLRFFGDVSEPGIDTVQALAANWSNSVQDETRAAWLSAEPWQWAAESYAITTSPATGYCVKVGAVCQYAADRELFGGARRSVIVDDAYIDAALPIIRERITRAGLRLAHLINLALDPAYRT